MSASDRAVDAWYMRWVVHACVVAVILLAVLSVAVIGRFDAATQPPRDRPIPASPVPITGGAAPTDTTARTTQAPATGN